MNSMADIRDPIHGFIRIEDLKPIIDCRAMQRLRRIRQLARADLVYPGLMHSRFEHSLGVLHVAREMAGRLNVNEHDKTILGAAALLHDVGQGPFSHVFEDASGLDHSEVTKKIILEDEEVGSALQALKIDPREILDVFNKPSILKHILDSPLDADKIDYLQRDSYHTRVAYGLFDYALLLHTLCIISDPYGSYLGVLEKGKTNALSFVLARYMMFDQVYHHKVRRITDNMLVRAIKQARLDGLLPPELFDIKCDDFLKCFLSFDDEMLSQKAMSRDGLSKRIFSDLRNRRLFKVAHTFKLDNSVDVLKRDRLDKLKEDIARKTDLEKRISEASKTNPEDIIVDMLSERTPLNPFRSDEAEILVRMDDHRILPLSEAQPIQSRTPYIKDLLVLCPGDCRKQVGKAAKEVIDAF